MKDMPCPHCEAVFLWDRVGDDARPSERVAANAFLKLQAHMKEAHPDHVTQCPRGYEAFWKKDGTCSACGSLSPEDFLKACEEGAKLGPTDKSYKVYVDLPFPDAPLRVVGSANHNPGGEPWFLLTEEKCDEHGLDSYARAHYVGQYVYLGRDSTRHAKFYFQHLDEAQMQRFIDMLNGKKLNIGMPGYFYTRPFFIRYAEPAQGAVNG